MALIPNRTQPARGVIGTWANMEEDNARTGFAASEFASAIPLQQASGVDTFEPLTDGNRFAGIALRTNDMQGTPTSDGAATFREGDLFAVADMGAVFVLAGASVTAGATPFYEASTRKFHGSSAAGRLPLPGCEFDGDAANGEPVALRIRLVPGADNVTAAE